MAVELRAPYAIDLGELDGLARSKTGKPVAEAIERAVSDDRMTYLTQDGQRAAAIVPLDLALAMDPDRPPGHPAGRPLAPLPEPEPEPAGASRA